MEDPARREIVKVTELAPTFGGLTVADQLNLEAIAATVRRNSDGARENYSKLVDISPHDQKHLAHFGLARTLESADETAPAIQNYNQAFQREPQLAAAAVWLGVLYGRQHDTAESVEFFDRAEQIYNSRSDYDGVAEVAYQQGYLLGMPDKLAPAAEKIKRAAELAELTKNTSLQVKASLQLSSITYALEDQQEAKKLSDDAIELARREGLDSFATIGLIETGNIYFIRGELKEAEAKFSLALERARNNEWPRIGTRANLALGSLFVQQGRAAEAIRFTVPALQFYEKNNFRKEILQAQLVLGYANDQTGN